MQKNKKQKRVQRAAAGLTLIEVVLAGALLGLIIGALVGLGVSSLRSADSGKKRGVALQLTKAAIEQARVERDEDSENLFSNFSSGYYRLASSEFVATGDVEEPQPPNLEGYTVDNFPGFYRVVRFDFSDSDSDNNSDTLSLWVKTYWREPGNVFRHVTLSSVLTRWR